MSEHCDLHGAPAGATRAPARGSLAAETLRLVLPFEQRQKSRQRARARRRATRSAFSCRAARCCATATCCAPTTARVLVIVAARERVSTRLEPRPAAPRARGLPPRQPPRRRSRSAPAGCATSHDHVLDDMVAQLGLTVDARRRAVRARGRRLRQHACARHGAQSHARHAARARPRRTSTRVTSATSIGTPTTTSNDRGTLQLWQLISPALPVGAFATRRGSSTCTSQGVGARRALARAMWLRDAARARRRDARPADPRCACIAPGPTRDAARRAPLEPHARRAARDGRAALRGPRSWAARWRGCCRISACGASRERRCRSRARSRVAAVRLGDRRSTTRCAGYAWAWCEAQVAAAVKLVPLGQTAGQRMLLALGARDPGSRRARAAACRDDEIGASLPGLAIASALHETQYTPACSDREEVNRVMQSQHLCASASAAPSAPARRALVDALCKQMRERYHIAVVTNDIYTQGGRAVPDARAGARRRTASSASRPAAARTRRSARTRR